MSPAKRGCLYPDEKDLRHFGTYREATCVLECSWYRAREACDCVPWFLLEHFSDQGWKIHHKMFR